MKNLIVGIALCLSPLCSYAETTFISEVLMGQSKHDMSSYLSSADVETNYSSAIKDTSFGFRLGVKFMDKFSLELSEHDHGSAVNEFTLSFPMPIYGMPDSIGGFLGPEHDVIYQVITPINIDSIRYNTELGAYECTSSIIKTKVNNHKTLISSEVFKCLESLNITGDVFINPKTKNTFNT